MKVAIVLGFALLAGCPLQKSASYSGPQPSSQPQASEESTPDKRGFDVEEDRRQNAAFFDERNFQRAEFAALAGLTIEQAKAKAKALGHTGEVSVRERFEFVDGCKPNTLWTNKVTAISGPPE